MISFHKHFLFVHIPKTAGNSIQSVLRDYSEDELVPLRGEQDGIERFGLRNPNYKIKKHSTLAEYRAALGETVSQSLQVYVCAQSVGPDDLVLLYPNAKHDSLGPEETQKDHFKSSVSRGLSPLG